MHLIATFNVFLWKHYKRLLFSWKKVLLSIIISSLSFFGILYFGRSQDPPAQQTSQVFPPLNLVIIFKIILSFVYIRNSFFLFLFVFIYRIALMSIFQQGLKIKFAMFPINLNLMI